MKFKDLVYKIVLDVPPGKVVTYGIVAARAGSPQAARAVGTALHFHNVKNLPWWRVISSKGYISTRCDEHSKDLQKSLLERDGVTVNSDYKVNLENYI